MSINCPKCQVPTTVFNFEADLNFDRCDQCKGMWMDKGELARTTSSPNDFPDPTRAASGPKTNKKCPKCSNVFLHEVSFAPNSKLIVDVCGSCQGLWLDSRELINAQKILRSARIEARKK